MCATTPPLSGPWLLLGLGAQCGPQQDGLPALAPVAQGWVIPSAAPCGSGTPWHSGPVPQAPLSSGQGLPRSSLCNFQFLSRRPHINWK